jgi:YegS/Rv2252/BmrU family lipid kinase
MASIKKALLFYNPYAGQIKDGHCLLTIQKHFKDLQIDLMTIQVPLPREELRKIVKTAHQESVELFLAAGGDGTVSFVSDTLVNTQEKLGILPLGTGNLIAKTLQIPLKLEKALNLTTSSDHGIYQVDSLFVVDDRNYISNVSVGVTPKLMESTCQDDKRRIGFFAYLVQLFQQLLGLKLHRYYLDYDHKKATYLASEILITNGRETGINYLHWSEDIIIDDGVLDIIIIRARNILDFIKLVISVFTNKAQLNPKYQKLSFKKYCRIETKKSYPVQADGDIIKFTPVEVHPVPRSVNIIVNKNCNIK